MGWSSMLIPEAAAVIPARFASTRLPGKMLADIHGRPLLWHVWSRVSQARLLDELYIATDSDQIRQAVESWGGQVLMTSPDCRSGTERIASILPQLSARLIVNVQGDEPTIDPQILDALVTAWQAGGRDILTPVYELNSIEDLLNPNVVKVARTQTGRALYFSRSPIPFVRDLPVERWLERGPFWGHVGVYAYPRDVLEAYQRIPPSSLESVESLEQLRYLEAGYTIQTITSDYRPVAVDTPVDLERVRQMMRP